MRITTYIEDYLKTFEPYQTDVLAIDGLRKNESISDVLEIIKSIGAEILVENANTKIFVEELSIPFQFNQKIFQLKYDVFKNENMRITKVS
ncbi:hypothetical protein [Enterococcus gallinarum]|uniref:hypothetical protein n=1 Tax=Enterococcus gallinarum TaxID=1353 RepID=UPI00243338F9|nr:hypothetical protein [Enterococcus gallinarum]